MNDTVKLIIEIPKELYETYKGRPPMLGDVGIDMIAQAIANGMPLPKGHGRLIDADTLNRKDVNCANVPMNFIDIASTIIEADTESE